MLKRIKKLLGQIGFEYCHVCGSKLYFDKKKFKMGYNAKSYCPICKEVR